MISRRITVAIGTHEPPSKPCEVFLVFHSGTLVSQGSVLLGAKIGSLPLGIRVFFGSRPVEPPGRRPAKVFLTTLHHAFLYQKAPPRI